jgi:hypothetical protein
MSGFQSRSRNRVWNKAGSARDTGHRVVRAYPVEEIDGLRPGMSNYTDWGEAVVVGWPAARVRGRQGSLADTVQSPYRKLYRGA